MSPLKVGIIGAGIAGLGAAVRMASHGHKVTVFEANGYPGGKLSNLSLEAFRFDAGPSLFTMPQYVEELFQIANEPIKSYFSYQKLPILCNYFWEDGTRLNAYSDPEKMKTEVESKLKVSGSVLENYWADSKKKYEICGRIFLEESLHRLSTWTNWGVVKAMLKIPTLGLFNSMHHTNAQLLKHPKLIQLYNRYATYNGSNPYRAPGLLTIIPHFETGFGAYIPEGGMHQITKAVYELGLKKGVQFHFDTPVEEIITKNHTATGLKVAGKIIDFDIIISNMDVFFVYQKLLPKAKKPKRILKQEKSTSALIFYWGIQKAFPELDLHNILFSKDYQQEFSHLANGKIYHDPTVYINITKKYCPNDAPEGQENWFTMINVPFNSGQDWDQLIAEARQNIIQKINRNLGVDLSSLIACEAILDPRSIEQKTASHLGALYGTSSNKQMAAFLRHPNFSNRIKQLYFCGGSVHPGGGIPLSLLSAKIIDDLIHKDYS